MTEAQWQAVWKLYKSGSSIPPEQIRAFLNTATDDAGIRDAVLEMFAGAQPVEPLGRAGQKIGRYIIVGRLGEGGMGEVFSARDSELGRSVAIKFLYAQSSPTASVDGFIREAKAASALNHPNIVTIYEVIHHPTARLAIVMEQVEGVALRRLCGTPMPVDRVIDTGAQIARALRAAHAGGIVHCDIKPENLMMRPDGVVKVLDFGMAQDLGAASSRSAAPAGTLRYMSPEQLNGEVPTGAGDVFSLGIVLYELAAGAHPFDRGSIFETLTALNQAAPPAPSTLNSFIPRQLDNLILSMLAREPGERPTAAAVAHMLDSGFRGDPASVQATGSPALGKLGKAPVPASPPAPPPSRAARRYVAAFVLLAAAALAFVVWRGSWLSVLGKPSNPTADLHVVPLASLAGAERQPSFSPDGNRVAFIFSDTKDPVTHVYIKNLSDGKLSRLTSDVLSDFGPAFSPDGAKIAFLRRAAGGRLRIMLTPASGGVEEQVGDIQDILYANAAIPGRGFKLLTWDASGKNILVADRQGEAKSEIALFQISIETGARKQITFPPAGAGDLMPGVSPDGSTLGFARMGVGYSDLWMAPLSGGSPKRLTNLKEVFLCWSWSQDGREVLISYIRSGRPHLWRQPTAGGVAARVAGVEDQVMELAVARTGNRIIYGSGSDEDYNVWRYAMPPSKGPPMALIASAAFDGDARYSPDGAHIAFVSSRSGQPEIWICSRDGSDPRQMTSGPVGSSAGSPQWSPDGRWIAFDLLFPEGNSSIFVLDVLGGAPRRLTGPGPRDVIPEWSRDSRWIYFSSNTSGETFQLWKAPASGGGEPVQVTQKGGYEGFESPDGRFLYYTKRRLSGMWRMPLGTSLESREETEVPGLGQLANRYWEASPSGIYFVALDRKPVLKLFHFSSNVVTPVIDLPVPPARAHRGLSMSPDGQTFLYMQTDLATTNLLVGNNFH